MWHRWRPWRSSKASCRRSCTIRGRALIDLARATRDVVEGVLLLVEGCREGRECQAVTGAVGTVEAPAGAAKEEGLLRRQESGGPAPVWETIMVSSRSIPRRLRHHDTFSGGVKGVGQPPRRRVLRAGDPDPTS